MCRSIDDLNITKKEKQRQVRFFVYSNTLLFARALQDSNQCNLLSVGRQDNGSVIVADDAKDTVGQLESETVAVLVVDPTDHKHLRRCRYELVSGGVLQLTCTTSFNHTPKEQLCFSLTAQLLRSVGRLTCVRTANTLPMFGHLKVVANLIRV